MKRRPPSPAHVMEMRRRERRRFEHERVKLGAGNMNSTKWSEVVAALQTHKWRKNTLRAKCVGFDHISDLGFVRHVNRNWADSFVGPIPYREIEWLEVRHDRVEEIRRSLASLGALPIVEIQGGFRIVGYGPVSIR